MYYHSLLGQNLYINQSSNIKFKLNPTTSPDIKTKKGQNLKHFSNTLQAFSQASSCMGFNPANYGM